MQKDDILNAAVGARIKEIREQKNISQDTMAELIDVCNGNHISNIERGHSGLSLPKFVSVCKALDISADYLLFGISSSTVETSLHQYLKLLNSKQSSHLMHIIKSFILACDIEIDENYNS